MSWLTKIKDFFKRDFKIAGESNHKVALAVGVGAMCAVLPIWGFQMLVAVAIAGFLNLNKILVLLVSNISQPPITPVWIYLSYITGCVLLGIENTLSFNDITLESASKNALVYVLGAVVFAILLGAAFYLVCFGILSLFRKQKTENQNGEQGKDA